MNIKLYQQMSDLFAPPGFEHDAADFVMQQMQAFSPVKDAMQNVYTYLPQNENRPLVMLDAHLDEVGFMIQSILPNGLLKLVALGGWVEHNIPAHSFLIKNREGALIRAIASSKPPHFTSSAERNAPLQMEHILLDAGVCSKEDALALGLEIGLPVVPEATCSYNEKTGLLLGKAFDCRLGCAGIIDVMHQLKEENLSVDVAGVFSTQEEVGLRGAKVTTNNIKPALAICLEGTPADDTFLPKDEAQGVVKKGVQIRFRDGTMVSNPAFVDFARKIAKQCNIPLQCAVRTGGGTNAGVIHLANQGIPTIVLGVPVRYAHTHYGYAAAQDVASAVSLTVEIIKHLSNEELKKIIPTL